MTQEAPPMTLPTSLTAAPKRPRLSLQTSPPPSTTGKAITALRADIDTTSPTAFNTLSNAYAAAIEQASPKMAYTPTPSTLGASTPVHTARPTSLRLVTNASSKDPLLYPSQRTQTPGPFSINYPDTPSTAYPTSSPMTARPYIRTVESSASAFTPPQSAHLSDEAAAQMLSPYPKFRHAKTPSSPRTLRRRATTGSQQLKAPYTHPRSLRSILRNSPLPPRSAVSPISPSLSSQRQADKGAKRVGYNSPLTQTITTNKYVKSHIELLAEEASPYSPIDPEAGTLDLAMAYTGDETRDGGQTPGPFEEMRRRMAGLEGAGGESDTETPMNRKRKREKKRCWVWTIGANEEDCEDDDVAEDQTPITAIRDSDRLDSLTLRIPPRLRDPSDSSPASSFRRDSLPDVEMTDRPGSAHSI
ncbi:MAG: hypothetical protein M1818_006689 [Claussenomyces sp. TS43310]|nr:MAG: hypothetical protein M1818_006689 [Claussenomyces sp. TS43310]